MLLIRKSEGADFAAIHNAADRLAPRVRNALLAAAKDIPADALPAIAAALENLDADEVIRVLRELSAITPDLAPLLQQVFAAAAAPAAAEFGLSFTIENPRAVRWAQRNTSRVLQEFGWSSATADAVRDSIARAIDTGIPPAKLAREMMGYLGLTDRDREAARRVLWEGLSDAAPSEVDRVLRRYERYRNQLLRRRAEMVARTETIRAANAGQRAAWDDAADAGLLDPATIRIVWIATEDARTCPICGSLDGKTIGFESAFEVPLKDPTRVPRGQHLPTALEEQPPAHPRCRCAVGLVETTDRDEFGPAQREGTDIYG